MAARRHVLVVGGGIVGLATARELLLRDDLSCSVTLLEAEDRPARHQTGRNSGVVHSGLYYAPGSLKARTCVAGRRALLRFCKERRLPLRVCGKVVVASREEERPRLAEFARRGRENGLVGLTELDAEGIEKLEPAARGVAGLAVPETGVVDFRQVAAALAEDIRVLGGEVVTDSRVVACRDLGDGLEVEAGGRSYRAGFLVGCAGLHADRLARRCGLRPDLLIVPFRGHYYDLREERADLVRALIYPVPDPRFPFLGVHLTRSVDDHVHAGPSALLAFAREGYTLGRISARDLLEMAAFPGFWRLGARYWRMGWREIRLAASRRAFADAARLLVPDLCEDDLEPAPSGVRAQAVSRDGRLLDDFCLLEGKRMLHVLNAPSPAATASLEIARILVDRAAPRLTEAA